MNSKFSNQLPVCYSLYWKNINPSIILNQRKIFEFLGIKLVQDLDDLREHGNWIKEKIESSNQEIIVFADIDAIPTSRNAYITGVISAKKYGIFGLAQYSNNNLYAGPMFLFLKRSIYFELGCPNLSPFENYDACEILTILASKSGIKPKLLLPRTTLQPKWSLGNKGVFGIGTFYGNYDFFHLFESRLLSSSLLFDAVSQDILNKREWDFSNYLKILKRESDLKWFRRIFKFVLLKVSKLNYNLKKWL